MLTSLLWQLRPLLLLAIALLCGVTAVCTTSAASASGDVVELPTVTVYDSPVLPPPESWRYAEFGGFEVISNATDKSTQHLLREFEIFRQALSVAWPMPTRRTVSSSLILSARGGRFDQFIPSGRTSGDMGTASLFLRDRTRVAIVLDLQAKTLTLADAGVDPTVGVKDFEVDTYRQLYREYVHFLMSQNEPRPPAWLAEGVAQMAMAMEFTEKWITFARIDSSAFPPQAAGVSLGLDDELEASEGETLVGERPFNVALARQSLMPMEKFFAVGHDAPEARNPIGNNRWAKQAYAFVHMCLYGHRGKYQKAFGAFVQRLGKEPPSEALFKECFNMTFKQMQQTLRGYIQHTNHDYKTFTINRGSELGATPPPLREATQAEIARIKGDALALAGHDDAARKELVTAYVRGERDPRLLAALGLAETKAGNSERARRFLTAAAKDDVTNPLVYIELARLQLESFTNESPENQADRLNEVQVETVLTTVLKARPLAPPLPDTYDVIAETWSRSAAEPTPEQLARLDEGIRLFPRHSNLIYNTARLYARAGVLEKAITVATFGIKGASDDATRQRFDTLIDSLQGASAPAGR